MDLSKYFIFYDNLILVKGCTRSIIIDPHNSNIDSIPNYLQEFATTFNKKSLEYITNNHINTVFSAEDAITFFLKNNFGFLGTKMDLELTQNISRSYDTPHLIENGVIDFGDKFSLNSAVEHFKEINCPFLQIRVLPSVNEFVLKDNLEKLFSSLDQCSIRFIDLVLPYYNRNSNKRFLELVSHNKRVGLVSYYSSPFTNFERKECLKIFWTSEIFTSEKMCGQVGLGFFTINPNAVFESHHHNSCLNRKISIDSEGNIKNCPSMKESYGNIRDTTLAEALEKPGFKKYWDINKDKIHVCKDCEFRYICTDCRAYVEDPDDILSKPLKCGYNPYTGEWSEWSTNPLKQKAIDFYGMPEMVEEGKDKSE